MTARIIDGKAIASALRGRLAETVRGLGFKPGLAVVLVGDDPASHVYVRNKVAQTIEVGMASFEHRLPADTPQAELMALVQRLNADPAVDGILVQLPLPAHLDANAVLLAIDPAKDVDGLHPWNAGLLATGRPGLVACTPLGCLMLIEQTVPALSGRSAVVIGRSVSVGRPLAALLLGKDCTVKVANSRTRDLAAVARGADILVAAVGRAELVRGDWVKPGAVVIDVGITRVPAEGGKTRLVGDVAFAEAAAVAGAITPVPGGVGPMTIACLLHNTVQAARVRRASA